MFKKLKFKLYIYFYILYSYFIKKMYIKKNKIKYRLMDFTLLNKAIIVIAKRNSGKSELIKYLLKDSIRYTEFDKIFVVSSTNSINNFYNDIISEHCIFTKY